MNIDLTGHHVDVTSALREYVNTKFERVERHFDNISNAHVVLSVEKLAQKAEATLNARGGQVFAEATEKNMYAAIDALTDKLDRLVKKRREKVTDHHNREAMKHNVHEAALQDAAPQ